MLRGLDVVNQVRLIIVTAGVDPEYFELPNAVIVNVWPRSDMLHESEVQ